MSQTSVRGGLGDIPTLGLPRALKAGIKPNVPESLASTPSIPSTSLERPFISREIGESIGSGLGRIGAVTSILAPLAGQGTAAQKETAVGKGAGLFAGSEIASRGASILGATEDLTEGVGLLPGSIAVLAGKGTAGQKASAIGQQGVQLLGQKLLGRALGQGSGEDDAAAGVRAGVRAGTRALEEGGSDALEGLEGGLAASGAETGGLGFIAAGIVGIGSALASIFSPHKKVPDAPPPIMPNLSIPVSQQGLS